MKFFSKKFTALVLALAMVLSIGVTVSAAVAVPYSVNVENNKIAFVQNGKTTSTYTAKDANITLTTDKDGDFVVCYYDTNGTYRAVNLAAQTALTIGGKMTSLKIAKELDDKIQITLASNADVATLTVATPNTVTVKGSVGTMSLTAAAKVTLASTAKVTKTSITDKKATVTTEKGASTGTTTTAPAAPAKPATPSKPVAPSKPAAPSTSGSSIIKLKISPIYAEDGDTLEDLLDELEDKVEAYDSRTRDYMSGTYKWATSRRGEIDSDTTLSFTFIPDEPGYDSVKGSIKVYVNKAHGDIILKYEGGGANLTASDGDKLKDLTDALNDQVYAEDDKGDIVEGKAKFTGSSSTTFKSGEAAREYSFTFTPKESRYDKATGRIKITVS